MVRKVEKKHHSRRKRIQLDEDKSRKSPDKEKAAPSSNGKHMVVQFLELFV